MEQIKQELVEGGVIGRILDDFNPQLIIHLFYGDTRMSSGDEVLLGDLRERPDYITFDIYPGGPGLKESFRKPKLIILIMTDPDGPGGEYLRWLATEFDTIGHRGGSWKNAVEYEPPTSTATRMLVLTMFNPNVRITFGLYCRESFSTRDFAESIGPPVAVAFFKIKNENEANNFVEVNALGQPVGPASFRIRSEEEEEHPESAVDDPESPVDD
eukprot:PITA_31895